MGILLDSVKFLKQQKFGYQTTPTHVYHVEELFGEDHGPMMESHINSEFWHVHHPKESNWKE